MFASCWRFSSENVVAWCGAQCAVFRIIVVIIFFCFMRYSFIYSNCLSICVHFFLLHYWKFGFFSLCFVRALCRVRDFRLIGGCLCVKFKCIWVWPTNFRNEIITIVIYIWPLVTNEFELIELYKQTSYKWK